MVTHENHVGFIKIFDYQCMFLTLKYIEFASRGKAIFFKLMTKFFEWHYNRRFC